MSYNFQRFDAGECGIFKKGGVAKKVGRASD